MSDQDVAIRVSNVSKNFVLPHQRKTSIKSVFTGIFEKSNKSSETQHALKDISFEIKKGEFFGIVGRNGSGKSTLLKILAGIYQPTKGNVAVHGKLVPFIELGVGFNPELTGRENVYLNGALLGFNREKINEMYEDIVSFAELEKFMDQKLKNYSSGMQVRLAFSMAIRADADILLIDEVLAVGDADFQRKCYEYFQRIKSQGVTVVFVTHDMGAVREYCDRAVLINKSEIVDAGDPESIAKQYTRLFSKDGGQEQGLKKERWGNKKATYGKPIVTLTDDKKNVRVAITVDAQDYIADPTYGIMVSNDAGKAILGTNSKIELVKVGALSAGDNKKIAWQFPNIFNEGRFNIELVLMYNSITEVADWWENAATFSVANDKKTPYIVNPPTIFKYED